MEISNIEKTRKRLFALFCILFFLIIILGFIIINILENDPREVAVNIIAGIILISGLVGITKFDRDLLVYRLILTMMSMAYLYSVSIGAGKGTAIYWLYPFPLVFVFLLGKTEGGLAFIIFFICLCLLLVNPFSFKFYSYSTGISSRFLISYLLVGLISYSLEASREKYANLFIEEQEKLMKEKQNLEQALKKVKTLTGLIPICSSCMKIRDDKGYWQQVDIYVRDHTTADFSHSLCPDCVVKLYPDIDDSEK